MASATTAAPKKGRKTNAEWAAENKQLEEKLRKHETDKSQKKATKDLWATLLGLGMVLAMVVLGIWFLVNHNSGQIADQPSPTPASLQERGTGYVSGSWGEVSQHLRNPDVRSRWDAMDAAMAEHRGFEIPDEAIDAHIVREVETADPDRYVWTADRPLTGWLNTNWDGVSPKIFGDSFQVGDQFLVMELDILAKYGVDAKISSEAIVTLPDGTVCVILTRAVCTNHVWPGESRKVVRTCDQICHGDDEKLPMYSGPLQTPHDPANPFTQDDPSYDVRESTDGYEDGNAEAVEAIRGTGPGTSGAEGTGSDGTTPGASITIDGVTVVENGTAPAGTPVDGTSGTAVESGTIDLDPADLGND